MDIFIHAQMQLQKIYTQTKMTLLLTSLEKLRHISG